MGRDLALERAWRGRLQEFEKSGLTVREFCEREGLVGHQLTWWRRELKRRSDDSAPEQRRTTKGRPRKTRPAGRATEMQFMPVQLEPASNGQPRVEIILDQPPRIAVSPGCDTNLLREVIRVLEQR